MRVEFFILAILCGGESYAYKIYKDAVTLSGHRFNPSTVYKALARMGKAGLVMSVEYSDKVKFFVSEKGREQLKADLEVQHRILKSVEGIIGDVQ